MLLFCYLYQTFRWTSHVNLATGEGERPLLRLLLPDNTAPWLCLQSIFSYHLRLFNNLVVDSPFRLGALLHILYIFPTVLSKHLLWASTSLPYSSFYPFVTFPFCNSTHKTDVSTKSFIIKMAFKLLQGPMDSFDCVIDSCYYLGAPHS